MIRVWHGINGKTVVGTTFVPEGALVVTDTYASVRVYQLAHRTVELDMNLVTDPVKAQALLDEAGWGRAVPEQET